MVFGFYEVGGEWRPLLVVYVCHPPKATFTHTDDTEPNIVLIGMHRISPNYCLVIKDTGTIHKNVNVNVSHLWY